jgi:hypothetical protein
MQELMKCEYAGKVWFMDFRLNQMRNVNDPNDYLDMDDNNESFEGLKVI